MVLRAHEFPEYFNTIKAEARITAEDAQHDPRTFKMSESYLKPLGITSLLDSGILKNGTLVGVVSAEHIGNRRKWYPDEESLLTTIASFVAQSLTESDVKQVEEALRRSESLLKAAGRIAKVGAWSADLVSQTLTWSDQMFLIHEIDPDYSPSMDESNKFIPPEWRDRVAEVFRTCMETGEPIEEEFELITAAGNRIWVRTRGEVVRNESGKVIQILGALQDITAQKHAALEREKLQTQLNQAQKMDAVGRLAGGVAHDFNNMLSVIIGNSELALSDLPEESPYRRRINIILDASRRSADLTRQLLAFARKQTIAPKVINLNYTVEGILNMLRRLIGENIQLAWLPNRSLGKVRMDPSQIDQVLTNLCINARDAIADVGKITIETENISFDKAYCAENLGFTPGNYILLAVSDNGNGMDKKTMASIFEPFFTTKEMGKGTGLGLSTVYGIVKQNKGFIHVYSEPNHGTTFRIYLPVEEKATLEHVYTTAAPLVRVHETVLIVEDEPTILEVTQSILKRLGYNVFAASTPRKAIRFAEERTAKIHLLITDVVMPEMNGRDLANTLLVFWPDLKCLFMSGYTANVIAHHSVLEEGINFIQKPFSMEDLGNKVRKALDKDKT